MPNVAKLLVVSSWLHLVACGSDEPTAPDPLPAGLTLEWHVVVSGFNAPTFLASPAGDPRLFVSEQAGAIRIIESGDQLRGTSFVDIGDLVTSGGEQGLLGFAFHPDYAANGFVFLSYTGNDGTSHIDRFTVSVDPNRLDRATQRSILSVAQPYGNHNGGMIAFGPDGHLYVGLGDGGSGNDPLNSGQDSTTLLGSLLRLDVDACAAGQCGVGVGYQSPADNPFVGRSGRDEIWAYGLRNPWRFSFDGPGGHLYIGDVGQNAFEEVDAEPLTAPGLNYGWRVMEGGVCRTGSGCAMTGLTLPVITYPNPTEGCAVIGGYVYRGNSIPEIVGHYFYSDACSGWLRSFALNNGAATQPRQWDVRRLAGISSFGTDDAGELYGLAGSTVYRLTAPPSPLLAARPR